MAGETQNQGDQQQSGQNSGGDSQQQTGKEYLQFFPEAIRGEKTLEKFSGKDVNEVLGKVATSYINLEKHAGGAVRIPGENATKEETAAFREKLGVPKDPAGYGITLKDLKAPEELGIDEAGLQGFLAWAHGEGFTKTQVGKIIDRFVQNEQAQLDRESQEMATGADQAFESLRVGDESNPGWGSLTGRNVALVQRGVREFGGAAFASWLDDPKFGRLGNDPRFMRFAYKVLTPLLEDGLIKGENLGMGSTDAKGEIDRLMASDDYKGKNGKEARLAAVEKIRELTPIAYPEG